MDATTQFVIGDLAGDTAEGEAARVLDPLWILGRQWQLGELDGEDNGSPVGARMVVEAGLLDRWRPGGSESAWPALTSRTAERPLEARVEAEIWGTGTHAHTRLAAETGLILQQLLAAAGLTATSALLREAYPLLSAPPSQAWDTASERYFALMTGRTCDGMALYRDLRPLFTQNRLQDAFATAPLARATDGHAAIAHQLTAWWNECAAFSADLLCTAESVGNAPSWQRERMEYAFATSTRLDDGEVTLVAREHFEGETDWYSYVLDPSLALGAASNSVKRNFAFLPTAVQFPGMPKPRFWELEDARVNLPRIARQREDAASSLFVDFALRYGNDWFFVPLPLPTGSVSRLRSLVVTNTFGERVRVLHAGKGPDDRWGMFSLTLAPGSTQAIADLQDLLKHHDVFVLPVTLGQVLDGAPVEQVLLARDEMANVGWAIEGLVESATGHRVDRAEQYARNLPLSPAAPAVDAPARYGLGSTVPDHWIPLLPEKSNHGELIRAAAPRIAADGAIEAVLPQGRLLEPGQALTLRDEEVPREGVVVTRRYRYARSADGHSVLWIGRLKRPGRGEASSGLRFDVVER